MVAAMVGVAIRWGAASLATMLSTGAVVTVAGLWMVATHVGLVRQGVHHQVPWGPVAYHGSTAVVVLAVGLAWVGRYRHAMSV